MTDKLYYRDIDKKEFNAEILEAVKEKKGWRVVLDKTCFFPEGGGQPADKGWLKDIPVTDVQKEGDLIYHYLAENPGTGAAAGRIDFDHRRDFMQQHTGQHILSGALWKIGGYKTLAVHMGEDYTTIEIEAPDIPEKDVIAVEEMANRVINRDLQVSIVETGHSELHRFPLRRPTDLKGKIRLVRIGDFDCAACGGLHFKSTREVELVKAIGVEKIRGNARIAWKIGGRAFADYREKDKIITALRTVLGTKEDMFAQKAQELQEEIVTYKRKCNQLENRLAETAAQNLFEGQQDPGAGFRVITVSWQDEDANLTKKILKNLINREKVVVCAVNVTADRVQWSIGCSADVDFSFDGIKDDLLSIIDGRGGGRFPLWQGAGAAPDRAGDFLKKFRELHCS
ncbi:MAG: hypothetical protein KAW12_10820 [Candidatus Aminicenantes bacterium]|nr:hypothetical protein [Candidatus Aminicenantes bacterium]